MTWAMRCAAVAPVSGRAQRVTLTRVADLSRRQPYPAEGTFAQPARCAGLTGLVGHPDQCKAGPADSVTSERAVHS